MEPLRKQLEDNLDQKHVRFAHDHLPGPSGVFDEASLGVISKLIGWHRQAIDKDLRQPDGGETEQQTDLGRFLGRTKAAGVNGSRRD